MSGGGEVDRGVVRSGVRKTSRHVSGCFLGAPGIDVISVVRVGVRGESI